MNYAVWEVSERELWWIQDSNFTSHTGDDDGDDWRRWVFETERAEIERVKMYSKRMDSKFISTACIRAFTLQVYDAKRRNGKVTDESVEQL